MKLKKQIKIINELIEATKELNGEYQGGWETDIKNGEELINYLKHKENKDMCENENIKTAETIKAANLNNSKPEDVIPTPMQEPPFAIYPKSSFVAELKDLINKHSMDGGSNTPDFILAEYLKQCLKTFDMCIQRREEWRYGK